MRTLSIQNRSKHSRLPLGAAWVCLLFIWILAAFIPAAEGATPPAGFVIKNRAEATYIPAGHQLPETIYSNTISVEVAAVESLAMTQDWTVNRPAGSWATLPHVLTNTGNTDSTYIFTLANLPGDGYDLTGLKLVWDKNGNGVADPDEPVLPLNVPSLFLASGQYAALLVVGLVPPDAGSASARVSLAVKTNSKTPISAKNTDTIRVGSTAAVSLSKRADQAGSVFPGMTINYQLVATNTGNSPAAPTATAAPLGTPILIDGTKATVFLIRDAVPAGISYVKGSLATSLPNAIKLYRLPGDPPFQYRTNGDDTAAIEVAAASPTFSLGPNVTTDLRFAARVKAGYSGPINNTGDAFFHDGGAPAQTSSNPILLSAPLERIGLAKRASVPEYEYDKTTGAPAGTALVTFTFVLESFSASPLYNVQITDLLEGAGRCGAYTSSPPGPGQYTIAGSAVIKSLRQNATATLNPSYDGTAANAGLFAPNVTLPANGALEVSFKVRINVNGVNGIIKNTAMASATIGNPAVGSLSEEAVNGSQPDANGDGDPANDASPTPVLLSLPSIDIVKTASKPVKAGGVDGTWEVDYTLTVTNKGKSVASYVRLADNLNCAFQTYLAPAPVESWQLTGPPTAQNGLLTINPGYTGAAACSAAQITNKNPYLAMPRDSAVMLTDGNRHLEPGATEVIRFTVRFTINPLRKAENRVFVNYAYAGIFDRQDAAAGQIVAASEGVANVTPLDPSGVVYNAQTRAPVAGAEVRLSRESCAGGVAAGPITAADILPVPGIVYSYHADGSVSMITAADGAYLFFLRSPPVIAACAYKLKVAPPAAGDLIWPSGIIPATPGTAPGGAVQVQATAPAGAQPTTYYLRMNLGPTLPDILNNHIPLDPLPKVATLLLEKKGNKSLLEIGGMLQYTLRLKNVSGATRTGFRIADRLPLGFRFISGSARLDKARIPDPAGAPGADLTFDFPALTLNQNDEVTLTYFALAGIGAPIGDAVNRATGYCGKLYSNEAAWKARVEGGVFSEEAFLIGKVFLDCDKDGVQGHEEVGIPGVRLILEDGTGVVTDVEGKYSLYGLRAITHVLKLDTTTLPPGAILGVLDGRNAGRGDSRFVDLKKGELHKANFAVINCDNEAVVAEVQRRRKALAQRPDAEGEAVSKARIDLQKQTEPTPAEVRSRGAAGELSPTGIKPLQAVATKPPAGDVAFESIKPRDLAGPSTLPETPAATPGVVPLEKMLPDADNTLAFIDLADGDTLPMALTNVRVKGKMGSVLQVSVNGKALPAGRVGKKARIADKQLEAWEYIGVELAAGTNTLILEEMDPFGNARGRKEIKLVAPGAVGRVEIDAPETAVADAATPVKIKVRLTDDKGVPVTARTQLTLEVNNGRWETKDLNPDEPGTQVFIQGGTAEFILIPPNEPLDAIVRVSTGILTREVKIAYLPELRPLIGAGILEGIVDLRHKGLLPVHQNNRGAFEQTLRNLSWDNGENHSAAGRAAFYFKGTIKGAYLLTVAYDSDKDTRERLFRDIQPDKYYPIYGDSSAKIFDAQSSERVYLRIDKKKSWLLYGDFTTDAADNIRQLSQFSRAMTGAKVHYESGRVSGNVFASRDSLKQVVVEFPANGTSGPYPLSMSGKFYENSEKVEILVRDRNQPSMVLKTIPMARFTDYMIEPLSGRLLFAGPVASVDENLNPRFIRVTCEVETGGPNFWIYGGDAQFKIAPWLQIGGSYARDENPDNKANLMGATAVIKLGERSVVTAEVARTETDLSGTGNAGRVEWVKEGTDLKLRAQATMADENFDNPTSGFTKGRTEATLDASYQVNKTIALRSQAVYSKDKTNGGERKGATAGVAARFNDYVQGEVGMRASEETTEPAQATSVGATPNDLLTVRARLGARIPFLKDATTFLEGEQDVRDSAKRMAALGGSVQMAEKTRLYGRHEFISSLGSPFSLNSVQEQNTTVIGLESAYLTDGRIFNEFRIRDAINGREALAATGVRKTWLLTEGLRLGGSFERTTAFGGVQGNDATAVTTALEYTGSKRYRLFGSLETRFAEAGDSYLNTLGMAYKINKDWSFLGRSAVSLQKTSSDGSSTTLSRQQVGFAWRQVDIDRWNALARYEYNLKDIDGGASPSRDEAHIVSLHVNYQPRRDLIASGRYAFKLGRERLDDQQNDYLAHLIFGRVTMDLWKDIDASLQGAYMVDDRGGGKYALGAEVGYGIMSNLWLSLGYNLGGFRDDALTGGDYTDAGVYLRLRFKFDEGLFKGLSK